MAKITRPATPINLALVIKEIFEGRRRQARVRTKIARSPPRRGPLQNRAGPSQNPITNTTGGTPLTTDNELDTDHSEQIVIGPPGHRQDHLAEQTGQPGNRSRRQSAADRGRDGVVKRDSAQVPGRGDYGGIWLRMVRRPMRSSSADWRGSTGLSRGGWIHRLKTA